MEGVIFLPKLSKDILAINRKVYIANKIKKEILESL